MKSMHRNISLIPVSLLLCAVIVLVPGCLHRPPEVEPEPPGVDEMLSCAKEGKEWVVKSPYFGNDEIHEATGVAAASPNPQRSRDEALKNAMDRLSLLYDSGVKSYSEQFVHEYRDWFRDPDEAKSDEIYDQLRTILHENRLKWVKTDACVDLKTGNRWAFVYTTRANLEAAQREASLEFQEYLSEERKEEFRKIMNEQINEWKKKDQEIVTPLPELE